MRLFSWLLKKFLLAAVLTGAVLAALGWWLFRAEGGGTLEQRQQQTRRTLQAELAENRDALAAVEAKIALQPSAIAAQELRARQAAKVAQDLDDLGSGLNRLTTDGAQVKENEARQTRLKQMAADTTGRVGALKQELVCAQWEKDGLELARDRTLGQLRAADANQSPAKHYALVAWDRFGDLVLWGVALVVFGPTAVRFFSSRRPADVG